MNYTCFISFDNLYQPTGYQGSRKTNRRFNTSNSSRNSWKMCRTNKDFSSNIDLFYEDIYSNYITRYNRLITGKFLNVLVKLDIFTH